ncbi:MAG: DUF6166 domain-containing protein [Acidimicrobiales bacterium]
MQVRVDVEGEAAALVGLLKHVELHSPDGFQWGYGGSGPADLALAILIDHLGEEPTGEELRHGLSLAERLHQDFKWAFVTRFGNDWSLTSEAIEAWLLSPETAAKVEDYRRWQSELAEIRELEDADADLDGTFEP